MTGFAIAILAAVLLSLMFGIFYAARRAMVAFEIRLREGKAYVTSGMPSAAFLSDVQEIATRNDIRRATIQGVRKGRRIQLLFHGTISKHAQQQMRNAWSVLR